MFSSSIYFINRCLTVICLSIVCTVSLFSQEPNKQIKKVHLIFKTHLDIGYTELSSVVERKYIEEFIPNTLNTIDQLRAENAEERYVWTTGSWLIWEYLQQATPEAVERLEAAIRRGDIVWHGIPYTVESEFMSSDLFTACLKLSQQFDRRFGKTTISAMMTDVPGHTRGIVTQLNKADISLLYIGINGASALPDIPPVCRWKNIDGKEIVLIWESNYGRDKILPDGETVISINFTGDNIGPHSLKQIKDIHAAARLKYPNAKIESTSLNEVAKDIQKMLDKIPVVTSEIGDTWIHGFGSSPLRMARYRALSRLFTQWLQTGKMDMNSPATVDFAVRLGMITEHTWGFDVKTHLQNWDKYDVDVFNASRDLPEFKRIEQSWAEIDTYIDRAIALLPEPLQREANRKLENIGKPVNVPVNNTQAKALKALQRHKASPKLDEHGVFNIQMGGINILAGELAYQTYSAEDYAAYRNAYNRSKSNWVLGDFGKPGLENSKAKSATIVQHGVKNCNITKSGKNTMIRCELQFPSNKDIDARVLPESTVIEYIIPPSGNSFEMKVSFINKPAVRLPEAYFLSFVPSEIQSILVEKMGFMVDVLDVVAGGNRQMHAIDRYLDIVTNKGTVRITSLDAPLVVIGERKMLNYSTQLPDLNKGVHFSLFNNLWGTNFTMWWEGSITYRFIIEVIAK